MLCKSLLHFFYFLFFCKNECFFFFWLTIYLKIISQGLFEQLGSDCPTLLPEVCLDSASDITVSAEHLQRNNKIAAPIQKTLVFLRLWVVKLFANMTKNKLKFITKCKIINIISHFESSKLQIHSKGYVKETATNKSSKAT